MSGLPIPDDAIDAAAKALENEWTLYALERRTWDEIVEAALRAAFTEMGMAEVRELRPLRSGTTTEVLASQLRSCWRPVEDPGGRP